MPQFFGVIDRKRDHKTGIEKISSEYPAWTFHQQLENAREELTQKERALATGSVDRESETEYRILIEREKAQLDAIEESRPNLSDADKDVCAKAYKDLTNGISASMPTLNDMHRNLVNAHEENRRNSKPCIKVSLKTAELAEKNGIKVTSNCEMSRKDASRLAKIIGHAIGEQTNMEYFRKEGWSSAGRPRVK